MTKVRSLIGAGILLALPLTGPALVGGCAPDTSKPAVTPGNPGGLSDDMVKQQEANEKAAKEAAGKK